MFVIPVILGAGAAVAGGAAWLMLAKSDTPYDLVVDINSLKALGADGWKIKLGKGVNIVPHTRQDGNTVPHTDQDVSTVRNTGQDVYHSIPTGVVVAVLGCYNRGKTYLLNQLGQIMLPSGKLVHTQGISMVVGKARASDTIFLDTAGTDAPIPNDELDDMRATEALLRELAIELCSIVIVVVNRLRSTDQIYIAQLLNKLNDTKRKRKVIIVHNLEDIESVGDCEEVIKREVVGIFDAKKQQMSITVNGNTSSVQFYTSQQNVHSVQHFVLAKQKSPAAQKWNELSTSGILNLIQTAIDDRKPLDLIRQMITYVNTFLPQLFVDDGETKHPERFQVAWHEKDPTIVLSERRQLDLSKNSIMLKTKEKLIYDNAGYFLGLHAAVKLNEWEPAYDLYEYPDKYILIVELAGCDDDTVDISINQDSATVMGKKDTCSEKVQDGSACIVKKIGEGQFELKVAFERQVENKEADFDNDHGLLKITIPKRAPESSRPKKKGNGNKK